EGESADALGLDGSETFDIDVSDDLQPRDLVPVTAKNGDGETISFDAVCRIDTPDEIDYYRNGGILHYVLRDYHKADKTQDCSFAFTSQIDKKSPTMYKVALIVSVIRSNNTNKIGRA